MKIKTLALTALAASMTFAACDNKDNGGSQPQDLMPKSVTITLPNIQKSTRATGDAMPGGSQVELTNFKVFFVNSANEAVTVPQFNNEDQKVFFSSEDDDWGTATGNKLTYHFLPATTAKVVVVGNIGDETYDNVKTKVCDVQNDADGTHPSYPLYGESGLTKGPQLTTRATTTSTRQPSRWSPAYRASRSTASSIPARNTPRSNWTRLP